MQVPEAVTNKHPWRPEGIKYRRNEVFLDVIEKVNLLVGANGTILRSEIDGSIQVNSLLSGMPELRLGLNDRLQFSDVGGGRGGHQPRGMKTIEMEDVKFHKCVSLSRFESDRVISFVPPDGEFELLSYRLTTNIKPLFWIEAIVESHAHSRIEYLIKAKSQFKLRSVANDVKITIPVPPDADSPKFRVCKALYCFDLTTVQQSIGTVKYAPEKDAIIWSIKQFTGGKEYLMRAHFGLPSVTDGMFTSRLSDSFFRRSRKRDSPSYSGIFRDSLLHRLRHSSALPQNFGEKRALHGAPLGALYYSCWRLPHPHRLSSYLNKKVRSKNRRDYSDSLSF